MYDREKQCGEVIISHNSNVHVAFTSGPIFYITKHFCIKTWLLKLKLYPRSANFVVFCVWGDYTWSAELCHPIVFTKLKFTGFRFGGPRRGFFCKNLSTKNKCIGIELCHDTFIFYIYIPINVVTHFNDKFESNTEATNTNIHWQYQ